MAKELPYYKHEPSEWLEGEIQVCSDAAIVCFTNLRDGYWLKLGCMSYAFGLQKYCRKDKAILNELIDNGIIDVLDDEIRIRFLDKQLEEFNSTSEKRRESANKRWNDAKAMQVDSKSNAIREEKIIEDNIIKEDSMLLKTASPYAKKIIPSLDEVVEYLVLEKLASQNEAEKFFDYYQSNGWRVGKNPMKEWKAAARNWVKNASNYNKQTVKLNQNGTQLTKQQLEEQEFNRRYGTTFGQQTA